MTAVVKEISIEELVNTHPFASTYLSEKGIRCIRCGEPIWGTLEEAAREKGFSSQEINQFIDEINHQISLQKSQQQ